MKNIERHIERVNELKARADLLRVEVRRQHMDTLATDGDLAKRGALLALIEKAADYTRAVQKATFAEIQLVAAQAKGLPAYDEDTFAWDVKARIYNRLTRNPDGYNAHNEDNA